MVYSKGYPFSTSDSDWSETIFFDGDTADSNTASQVVSAAQTWPEMFRSLMSPFCLFLLFVAIALGGFGHFMYQKKINDAKRLLKNQEAESIHQEYAYEIASLERTVKENTARDARRRGEILGLEEQLRTELSDKRALSKRHKQAVTDLEEQKTLSRRLRSEVRSSTDDRNRKEARITALGTMVHTLSSKLRRQNDTTQVEDLKKQVSARDSEISNLEHLMQDQSTSISELHNKNRNQGAAHRRAIDNLRRQHREKLVTLKQEQQEYKCKLEESCQAQLDECNEDAMQNHKTWQAHDRKLREFYEAKLKKSGDVATDLNNWQEYARKLKDHYESELGTSQHRGSDLEEKLKKAEDGMKKSQESKCIAEDAKAKLEQEVVKQLEAVEVDKKKMVNEATEASAKFNDLERKYKALVATHAQCPPPKAEDQEMTDHAQTEPEDVDDMKVDSREDAKILRLEGELRQLQTANSDNARFKEEITNLNRLLNEQKVVNEKSEAVLKAKIQALTKQLQDAVTSKSPPPAQQRATSSNVFEERKLQGELKANKTANAKLRRRLDEKIKDFEALDKLLWKRDPKFTEEYRSTMAELEQVRKKNHDLEAAVESGDTARKDLEGQLKGLEAAIVSNGKSNIKRKGEEETRTDQPAKRVIRDDDDDDAA